MANINIFNGFLKAFIRAEAEFENDNIPELLKGDFIFALSNDSSTNLAAVDKICKKMGFIRPSNRSAISPINRNYFQLKEPKQLLPWARSKRKHSDDLYEISKYPDISKKLKESLIVNKIKTIHQWYKINEKRIKIEENDFFLFIK